MTTPPTFSVVVPTHRRADHLKRCLDGLSVQDLQPLEVIVVHARDDSDSPEVLRGRRGVIQEIIERPSNMLGLESGVAKARGDVVCVIDDDAIPRPDWLARMATHFADPLVGAVGGRDAQPGVPPQNGVPVGRIGRWGKLVGSHHVGAGRARPVDVLKGVNMAFRREVMALPVGLRGAATQDHFEISMSLWVARHGRRVIYDPALVVDHFPAPRVDGSHRFSADPVLARASAFNLVLSIVSLAPELRVRRALYGLAVGDRGCPGILRGILGAIRRDPSVCARLWPSLRGQSDALVELARRRPLRMLRLTDGITVTTGRTLRDEA